MSTAFITAVYVAASILFILSLGGMSNQESAKRSVWYGIVGMALAVAATLIGPGSGLWLMSLILIGLGGQFAGPWFFEAKLTFWLEAVILAAFGVSWLVQGRAVATLADPQDREDAAIARKIRAESKAPRINRRRSEA